MESRQESFSPTLVIGLGGAGCRMLSTVMERAEEEGVSDCIEPVAIDSDLEDLQTTFPDLPLENSIVLEYERGEIEALSPFYLPEDVTIPDRPRGTVGQRALGRSILDTRDNFVCVLRTLDAAFDRAKGMYDNLDIFILNSLGGGTGSGIFPLVAALVRWVAPADAVYWLRGVGTLPSLERNATIPQINAYTALRELRTLLDRNPNVERAGTAVFSRAWRKLD